jgi:hypothetical protein
VPEAVVRSVFALRDTSSFKPDGTLGLTGRPIVGVRVVLEWCARAIVTKRGRLRWAPNDGDDIREMERGDYSIASRERKREALNRAIQRVDFVTGIESTLRILNGDAYFTARVAIINAGVYPLAVSIGEAAQAIVDFGSAA